MNATFLRSKPYYEILPPLYRDGRSFIYRYLPLKVYSVIVDNMMGVDTIIGYVCYVPFLGLKRFWLK